MPALADNLAFFPDSPLTACLHYCLPVQPVRALLACAKSAQQQRLLLTEQRHDSMLRMRVIEEEKS